MPELQIWVLLILFSFSVWYNWLIGWIDRKWPEHDLIAEQVIGGVLVVLVSLVPVLGRDAALTIFLHFAIAGFAMWFGAKWRYHERVKRTVNTLSRLIDESTKDRA